MTATHRVAAFDVDGTLTRRDCVVPFIRRVGGTVPVAARLAMRSHRLLPAVLRRDRDEVKALAGDDDGCCLFRLKERCHALFRPRETGSRVRMRREALFDLAVGALFHESMKFRENLYQREVYGPRMRALRSDADAESRARFTTA